MIVPGAREEPLKTDNVGALKADAIALGTFPKIQPVHLEKLTQARYGVGVVIHTVIDPAVVETAVPSLGLHHQDSRALPAAPVTAFPVPGEKCGVQPVSQVNAAGFIQRSDHCGDDALTCQDISLRSVTVAGHPAGPWQAGGPGKCSHMSSRIDDAHLALLRVCICAKKYCECFFSGMAVRHQF
jgi:hypothetical protein